MHVQRKFVPGMDKIHLQINDKKIKNPFKMDTRLEQFIKEHTYVGNNPMKVHPICESLGKCKQTYYEIPLHTH